MRTIRLFYPGELKCNTDIRLNKNQSAHLVRVLRCQPGTVVTLFNGNGKQYQCKMVDASLTKTTVAVLVEQTVSRESSLEINLVQGVSRNDRMELCIQKATELGVYKITPVICERSNYRLDKKRQEKKLQHWQSVANSACEQSGRNIIPAIEPLQMLNDYFQTITDSEPTIFLHPDAGQSLKTIKLNAENSARYRLSILVGPEGGFSLQEINQFKQFDWQAVKVGPRILRTETAGPAVIASLQILWGDF